MRVYINVKKSMRRRQPISDFHRAYPREGAFDQEQDNDYWDDEPQREVSAVAVVHPGSDSMLMGLRNDNERWTNPGGHLEPGEDPIEAAVRELYEETGIEADFHDLKHLESEVVNPSNEYGQPIRVHAYSYIPESKPEVTIHNDQDQEIGRWKWIPLNQIPQDSELHVPRGDNVLLKQFQKDI